MAEASLGTRTIDELHEEAILLWIHLKRKDPTANPAHGIYFALTNEAWPPDMPDVTNAIDLCAVLSEVFGQPPLSDAQRNSLEAKALLLLHQYESGGSSIRFFGYLIWANRVGYVLGIFSLLLSGFSWWIIGLIFVVWSCFGSARTAINMAKQEKRPSWEFPAIAAMHLVALVSLYVVSTVHLLPK